MTNISYIVQYIWFVDLKKKRSQKSRSCNVLCGLRKVSGSCLGRFQVTAALGSAVTALYLVCVNLCHWELQVEVFILAIDA